MRSEIREKLTKVIKKLYKEEETVEVGLATVAGVDFAANTAMKLAKKMKRKPIEIAEEIKTELEREGEERWTVEVAGPGFLNFILSDEYVAEKIGDYEYDFLKNISPDEYQGKTVICEFSDPNPFKVLHVGHLYTSIVGDGISRLIELAGGKVIRANFGGDVGLHVAKTMYMLLKKTDEIKDEMSLGEKAELMAKCYVEGEKAYGENEEVKAEIINLNKKIYQLEETDNSLLRKLYAWGRKTSYDYFEDFYKNVGVKFDKYYPESTVAGKGLEVVRKQLSAGVYEESDGAVVFNGEKYGLHTRVFINGNGLPTYEAKDVGLIFTKYEDYKFDKSIVITGNDIVDYMKVVLKSIEQYAPELTERTLHLTHGNVRLAGNVKMSSRKGNFLKAVEVLDLIGEALEKEYESKDKKVLLGAVKYAFLKYKIGGDIIFEPEDSVSMSGNSGPYLQYAAVRAKKVLGKMMEKGVEEKDEWQMNEYERALSKKVIQYGEVIEEAVRELSPHKLAAYLYELAQEFSRFYEKVQVAGSEYEGQRGRIVLSYLKVMTHGLGLLGIEVPEKM